MNFNNLIHVITETDTALKRKAYSAINQTLTIRNWLYLHRSVQTLQYKNL